MFGHIPEGYYQKQKEDAEERVREQLRDQFAMAALFALIADPQSVAHPIGHARLAYEYADAMLSAREKKK